MRPLAGIGGTAVGGYEPLPQPMSPYLPDAKDPTGYTLVLDLDETLVHYYEVGGEGSFRIRPGCDKFLEEMSKLYEVCIFTAAMQDYADWVLDQIDKEKRISYRMYRQHASPTGMVFIKDLSKIGRPLNKTIIVDNVAENFTLQPDNGIFIKSWFDDMNDTALLELAPLLK
jgi:CTD small phosphatase-like protein 2